MMNQDELTTPFRFEEQGLDTASLKHSLVNRLVFTVGKDYYTATERDWFYAAAYTVRDRLIERWMETMRAYYRKDSKRVYYFSLEFLIGRSLINSLMNLRARDSFEEALEAMGLELESTAELEFEAALGNGGLGRLAACLLDSMATLGIPGYGYGIRYEFGMFRQRMEEGRQVEHPDNWLRYGNPWEFSRPEVLYKVDFGGRVTEYIDEDGHTRYQWVDTEQVMAMAYDTPIPGYGGTTVNNLRLWSAKSSRDFDLRYFNEGNYIKAVEDKTRSENLSKVLYPSDITAVGRELRLQQQFFFVSASLQDILFRFHKQHTDFDELPAKVAVQLNDTHPAIAVPELMRLLMDTYHVDWDRAWRITVSTFAYTNHTLLPEALETWPVSLFERLLPRHLQIIYEINHRFLRDVKHRHPGDTRLLRTMSIIEEGEEKRVRMAHLAVVGSHAVNGVARIHTELLKTRVFPDFHDFFPGRFINVTNGVTPRRWLNQANPALAALLKRTIGSGWVSDLTQLRQLEKHADDLAFQQAFRDAKRIDKERLAELIRARLGTEVEVDSLFDLQVKRIHEYKRQLLNLLHVVTRYNRIRDEPEAGWLNRTVIFSGKAAPSYDVAKLVIRLINDVADVVNNDPAIGNGLRVVFVPNYDVSTAADLIPAADLSEQISTAGTEASGTGNMKLALNGALTIGTLDGANLEIRSAVGDENIFIFGHTVEELTELRRRGYTPTDHYAANPELERVLNMIRDGYFNPEAPGRHLRLFELLTETDAYMHLADYPSYVESQEKVDELYRDPSEWTRRAILNVARTGYFSSDRTVREYAEKVWNVVPDRMV